MNDQEKEFWRVLGEMTPTMDYDAKLIEFLRLIKGSQHEKKHQWMLMRAGLRLLTGQLHGAERRKAKKPESSSRILREARRMQAAKGVVDAGRKAVDKINRKLADEIAAILNWFVDGIGQLRDFKDVDLDRAIEINVLEIPQDCSILSRSQGTHRQRHSSSDQW